MLWRMLAKADSQITLEKVKQLPLEAAIAILTRIAETVPLVQTQPASKPG